MNYDVRFSRQIQHQIAQLPGNVRNLAKQRIFSLRNQPRPPDARELENHFSFHTESNLIGHP